MRPPPAHPPAEFPYPVAPAQPDISPPQAEVVDPEEVSPPPDPRTLRPAWLPFYVALAEIGANLPMEVQWEQNSQRFRWVGPRHHFVGEPESSHLTYRDVKLRLQAPLRVWKDNPYISRDDYFSTVLPLLQGFPDSGRRKLEVILLDPGHGGRDFGAINEELGVFEKVLTLALALRLEPMLREEGFIVHLTRYQDRYLSLEERVQLARDTKADLMISLHFNSAENTEAHGLEVFRPLFRFENPDPVATPAVNPANHIKSLLAALHLQRAMVRSLEMVDRGVKMGNFYVLRELDQPVLLLEAGFLSNPAEARLLSTPVFLARLSASISEGLVALREELGPTAEPRQE